MLDRFRQIKQVSDEEGTIIGVHHRLMKEYGYIPLDELKQLPIPTVMELLEQIEDYHKEMKKAMKKRR